MRLATIAACAIAAFAVAACGKSSNSSTSSSSATPSGSASTTAAAPTSAKNAELEMYDYRFDPKTIKGKPGQKVTLELKNKGSTEHNFTVDSQHIDKDVEKGKDAKVTVTLPKSGTLQFYCSYHKASHNMVGALNVSGASASTPAPSSTNTNTSSSGSGGYGY